MRQSKGVESIYLVAAIFLLVACCVGGCGDGVKVQDGGDMPYLDKIPQGGPNDIRDILILDDGFLAATGDGIAHYTYAADSAELWRTYRRAEGLPSNNCLSLAKDAEGGVWAMCEGGVARLGPEEKVWKAFTEGNGLAPGRLNSVVLSPDGRRVWVASAGGLATCSVDQMTWQVSTENKHLISILVHPSEEVVWCERKVPCDCECPYEIETSEFDLKTGEWIDLPSWDSCAPIAFSVAEDRLWLMGSDKPMVYDRKTKQIATWTEPDWRPVALESAELREGLWFREALLEIDEAETRWFATENGLAAHDSSSGTWAFRDPEEDVLFPPSPASVRSRDGKMIYLADDEELVSYSPDADQWELLFEHGDWFKTQDGKAFFHVFYEEAEEFYGKEGPWQYSCSSDELPDAVYRPGPTHLVESPDGGTLWWFGSSFVLRDQETGAFRSLRNQDAPGLSHAKFVRFDTPRELALVGTPMGIVGTDYDGRVRFRAVPSQAEED